MHFHRATFSTNDNILNIGDSTSPAFCSDSYHVWWKLQGIVGVDDIKSPPVTVNGKNLPEITLVGGFVTDPFDLIGETSFQECGKLCNGCYSDYTTNKEAMVAAALPGAAPGEGGRDSDSDGILTGTALAMVILASLVGAALLGVSLYLIVKTVQGNGASSNFATIGMRTTTTRTTTTTKNGGGGRHFPPVGGRTVVRT